MKESIFNVEISLNKKYKLIFNTLSKSLIKIEKNSKIKPSRELEKLGFFINDLIDEGKILRYWLKKRQYSNDELVVEILVTNNCNLKCEYCFAEYRRNRGNMTKGTEEAVTQWIIERVNTTHPKKLRIVFSGGEPFLKIDTIIAIMQRLKRSLHKISLALNFGVITNGTLITSNLIKKLIILNLKWVQITLDGPDFIHDQRRPFADDKGSFFAIIQNLKEIIDYVPKIYLRVNLDYENYNSVSLLIDFLQKNIKGEKQKQKIFFQFARVTEMDRKGATEKSRKRLRQFNKEVGKWIVRSYMYTKNKGFNTSINLDNIFDPHGPCMFMSRNSFIISANGDIHKCVGLIVNNSLSVGNVKSGLNFNIAEYAEKGLDFIDLIPCKNCNFLPVCLGGCRQFSYLDNNDLWKITCPKDYFINCSIELIKVLYEE